MMSLQQLDDFRGEEILGNGASFQVPGNQRRGEFRDIFLSLAHRRQVDLKRDDAEEQVFAELAIFDHLLHVP
ncbi:MAG: hypothetical protein JWN70_1351, partial [Planctomycetaceae bacterium]|nr:hypothetical protein [Planctomycetaceae bacterium]